MYQFQTLVSVAPFGHIAVTSSALKSLKTSCIINIFLKKWKEINVTGGVLSPNVKVLVLRIEEKYFVVY